MCVSKNVKEGETQADKTSDVAKMWVIVCFQKCEVRGDPSSNFTLGEAMTRPVMWQRCGSLCVSENAKVGETQVE